MLLLLVAMYEEPATNTASPAEYEVVPFQLPSQFKPTGPGAPLGPGAPCRPCAPLAPNEPVAPCGPSCPVLPCGPVAPAAPKAPCGPVGPVAPTGPWVPLDEQARQTRAVSDSTSVRMKPPLQESPNLCIPNRFWVATSVGKKRDVREAGPIAANDPGAHHEHRAPGRGAGLPDPPGRIDRPLRPRVDQSLLCVQGLRQHCAAACALWP